MANIDDTTPQLKVVKGLNDALIALNIKDVEPLLSRDFVLRTFPKSAELPDLTKEQYLQKNSAMWALSSKVDVTFHEVIEAPGKVVLHHSFVFTTIDGSTIDYDCVLILSFVEEDGELKVLEGKDFSDPEMRRACYTQIAKLMAQGTAVA